MQKTSIRNKAYKMKHTKIKHKILIIQSQLFALSTPRQDFCDIEKAVGCDI